MTYWLTSMDRKVHQRALNRLVREFNKTLEKDELWCGRFKVRQVGCPQWRRYEDGSGAELWVKLKFIDCATGRYYVGAHSVNEWSGITANGYRIWELMNWLITRHWDVWKEDLAQEQNLDAWREYNAKVRVC